MNHSPVFDFWAKFREKLIKILRRFQFMQDIRLQLDRKHIIDIMLSSINHRHKIINLNIPFWAEANGPA